MDNQKKEGVSVKEIEEFTKKHRFEVFFCLEFIFACFFSFVFFGPAWAVIFAAIGGILGVVFHTKVEVMCRKVLNYIFSQEEMTQLVLGIVGIILAIFLPPLIFLKLGLHGGKDLHRMSMGSFSNREK